MRVSISCLVLLLAGCEQSRFFLDPAGPIAAAERAHFLATAGWTMLAIAPVLIGVPLLFWRYRRRNAKACYAPDWDAFLPLDVAMWGVPFAIVTLLAVHLWRETANTDPYRPIPSEQPSLRVQVVGLDWKWLFLYPDEGIATVGEMAFPEDRPVALTLTSDTVMQSFIIGALAGQIYVMPGMVTQLHLMADAPGTFEGENTQYVQRHGLHRPEVRRARDDRRRLRRLGRTDARGMTEDAFADWAAQIRAGGIPLMTRPMPYWPSAAQRSRPPRRSPRTLPEVT